jgi:hypothetical protein
VCPDSSLDEIVNLVNLGQIWIDIYFFIYDKDIIFKYSMWKQKNSLKGDESFEFLEYVRKKLSLNIDNRKIFEIVVLHILLYGLREIGNIFTYDITSFLQEHKITRDQAKKPFKFKIKGYFYIENKKRWLQKESYG